MKIAFLAASTLFFQLPIAYSVSSFDVTKMEDHDLQDQPRRGRRQLVSSRQKQKYDCVGPKCLLPADDGNDENSLRQLSYVDSYEAAMNSYTQWEDSSSSTSGDVLEKKAGLATTKQAVQVGMELICDPDSSKGDNPCVEGCGHAPVPNPFNHGNRADDQVPSPCKNYDCICADSGCAKSWDIGCIKWYMQCQTQTQVCGSLDDAPTAVQNFNIGTSCALAPTSANTAVCFFQELSTPAPTVAPSSSPTDICSVEVEFTCVDAETETIPCGDIETPVDLKCKCPEGAMDTLTFYYSGPDGATLDCNSGAFVFTDLKSDMDVVFGPTTEIPDSMVCSVSVGGTVIDQFEVDSSCVGSGTLVLEQTFGNNGSGGPILTFDGYTCESGDSSSCSEEVTYIVQICNPGSGEEVVTSVTLNITADGIVVESVDFTGSPPLGSISGNSCIEVPHSSSINVCTEFVYEAVVDVEMVPPTSGTPCEGSSTIIFTSSSNTLPPTFSPTDFPTISPTKAPTPSPTNPLTEPPIMVVETIRPTFSPEDFTTPSPTKAPTEPPFTIVETQSPTPVVPAGDDDDGDDDDDNDDGGKGGKDLEGKGGKNGSIVGKNGGYDHDSAKKGDYYGGFGKKGAYSGGKKGSYSGGKTGAHSIGKGGGLAKPTIPTTIFPTGPSKSVPSPNGPSKPVLMPPSPAPTVLTGPTPVPVSASKPSPIHIPPPVSSPGGKGKGGKGGKSTGGKAGKKSGDGYDSAKKGGYNGVNGKKGAYAGGKNGVYSGGKKGTYSGGRGGIPIKPSKPVPASAPDHVSHVPSPGGKGKSGKGTGGKDGGKKSGYDNGSGKKGGDYGGHTDGGKNGTR